jgi:hypothetical protein
MRRAIMAVVGCLFLAAVMAADTPGETAVKEAIKTLKEKRAVVKDRGDQALLDAVITDLEERLAQIGKGEPEPEAKKDEPFVMPKGWELRFHTGKNRATFDPKTGVLKFAYDFSDPKQMKDFEFSDDVKPTVQRGTLTIKGGDEIKHVVKFKTISVGCVVVIGARGKFLKTSEGYWLFAADDNHNTVIDVCYGEARDTFIAGKGLGRYVLGKGIPVAISEWFVGDTKTGLKAGFIDVSGKKKANVAAGHLILSATSAPNSYAKLTISGTLDPEWAKEFFADKK